MPKRRCSASSDQQFGESHQSYEPGMSLHSGIFQVTVQHVILPVSKLSWNLEFFIYWVLKIHGRPGRFVNNKKSLLIISWWYAVILMVILLCYRMIHQLGQIVSSFEIVDSGAKILNTFICVKKMKFPLHSWSQWLLCTMKPLTTHH